MGQNLATMCVLCSHNCGIRVDVEDGRIVAVRGDDSHPITRGYVCNKAYSVGHYVRHRERVEEPLRRRSDGPTASACAARTSQRPKVST